MQYVNLKINKQLVAELDFVDMKKGNALIIKVTRLKSPLCN